MSKEACIICEHNRSGWCLKLKTNDPNKKKALCWDSFNFETCKVESAEEKLLTQSKRDEATAIEEQYRRNAEVDKLMQAAKIITPITAAKELKWFSVVCIGNVSEAFRGTYRRDLEKQNWHYFEDDRGQILHFRKEHIIYIKEHTNEII